MKDRGILSGIWRFFRTVLLIDLAFFVAVGVSFLFTGEFTAKAYSDRLFWAGLLATLSGFPIILASLGSYTTLGTPNILTAPGDAPITHERIREHIRTNEGRYMLVVRMATVGVVCIVTSALIQVLSR